MFNLAAILIGAIIIVAGIILLFIRSEAGISRFRLFGQEVELPAPALVVLICGAALFALPFLRPASDAALWRRTAPTSYDPQTKAVQTTAFDTMFVEEVEPNDSVHEANVMGSGQTVRGSLGLADFADYFVVDLPPNREENRIFVRPNWDDNTDVRVFDKNEQTVKYDSSCCGNVLSFTTGLTQQYVAKLTKSSGKKGSYELFISDSR